VIGGVTETRKGYEVSVNDVWCLDVGEHLTPRSHLRVRKFPNPWPPSYRDSREPGDLSVARDPPVAARWVLNP
jgi:hypothetical protein